MNRLHVSVTVADLDAAKTFYGAMFGATPSVERPGYAKWMLDDPRVNFVATEGAEAKGVNHLGIQAEHDSDLSLLYDRFEAASSDGYEEGKTECCYARSEKTWVTDPAGLAWEAFLTSEIIDNFGNGPLDKADIPEGVSSAVINASQEGVQKGVGQSASDSSAATPSASKSSDTGHGVGGCC